MRKYEWSMETIEWLQADPAELEQADQSQPETQLVLFLDSAGKDERAAEQYLNGIRDFDLSAPIRFFTEQGNDAAAKLLQNWRSRAQKQTSGESTLLRKRWDNWKKDYEGYSEFELEQRIQEGNEFARLALAERRLHSTSLIDKQQGLDELMAVRQHFAEQLSANGEDEKTLRVIISSLSLLMGDWYKRLDGKLAGRDLKQAAYTRYLEAMEMHEYWVDRPVRCCCNGYGTEVSENRALQWLEQALPLFGKRPNRYSADLAMQTAYLFEKKGQLVPAKSRLQWVLQNSDA